MPRDQAFHYFLEASRYAFADRNAYLADPAYYDVPLSGLLSNDYAADAARADHDDRGAPRPSQPGNPYPYVTGEAAATATHVGDDDAPRHLRQVGQRRLLHVHDRVDRRLRPRRAGLGLPAQQRADRLQLRLDDAPEPRRGRQAAAQLDGADDRARRNGKPFLALGSPGGSTIITTVLQILFDRLDQGMTLPQAIADPRASQRNGTTTSAEPAFLATPLRTQLEARGHRFVERRRDRRRDRDRVPARRRVARGGRARPPRRRQRDGREPVANARPCPGTRSRDMAATPAPPSRRPPRRCRVGRRIRSSTASPRRGSGPS